MPSLIDLMLEGRKILQHSPWPRAVVDASVWTFAANELAQGRWSLLGLWGEPTAVHMAIMDRDTAEIAVASLDCPGRVLSFGRKTPSAGASIGAHGQRSVRCWCRKACPIPAHGSITPTGASASRWAIGSRRCQEAAPYRFLPVEGEGLHQIAVGPVHAGIIEPGHFRFTASGETVVRLEQRLGYTHKGIEGLMRGASLDRAAQLAGRVSGDSTVAYAYAFSRAAEAAMQVAVPARAVWLRALLAELERLANHLGDIGAICNDASFGLMQAHCNVLREQVLRAANVAFGHRLMRDIIVAGGIVRDLDEEGRAVIRATLDNIHQRFPALVELYDNTASLQDRTVGTGIVSAALARQYGAGGYVGRGSGRRFDARRAPGYPPYDDLRFEVPVLDEGDVNARVWIRIREVEQSLSLVGQILDRLPDGPLSVAVHAEAGPREGMALVEGFRGDIMVWLRLNGGRVDRCHLRDPSWFQWPLLEAAIENNIVADFPLCNKSFNCSYSGHDL